MNQEQEQVSLEKDFYVEGALGKVQALPEEHIESCLKFAIDEALKKIAPSSDSYDKLKNSMGFEITVSLDPEVLKNIKEKTIAKNKSLEIGDVLLMIRNYEISPKSISLKQASVEEEGVLLKGEELVVKLNRKAKFVIHASKRKLREALLERRLIVFPEDIKHEAGEPEEEKVELASDIFLFEIKTKVGQELRSLNEKIELTKGE